MGDSIESGSDLGSGEVSRLLSEASQKMNELLPLVTG